MLLFDNRGSAGSSRLHPILLLLLLVLVLLPSGASAQAPERVEAFVYGINAAIPGAVVGTFAPPSVDTIYILSDMPSVLSPRNTQVYWWPITNEYRAAWTQLNEQVQGKLEVLQNGRVVTSFEQMPYTIHFTAGDQLARPTMYMGQEAIEADRQFQAEQQAYRQAALAYQEARDAWIAAARDAQQQGHDPTSVGPEPTPPPAFTLLSTGLNSGFPVELEPGSYEIQTRAPGGNIVEGSQRKLEVFAPRRTAVGYEVVPEARWTFPEELNDLADAILGEPDSVLYLKPRIVREYPALAYERLQDPQFAGDVSGSEWMWATGEALQEGVLEVVRNGNVVNRIANRPYHVKQVPGRDLGYEVLPYDPNTPDVTPRVDLVGFRLPLSSETPSFEVRLRSPEGELMAGSTREVRVVKPAPLAAFLSLALIPLLVGFAVIFWRRRSTAAKGRVE
jgi:hypothetical protein